VKVIFSGAAHLAKDVEQAVIQRFKNRIIVCQGYGMSETTLGVTRSVVQLKPGTVGKVSDGQYAKVIDVNGKSLGPNKVGELCFIGPMVMKGYLGNSKATAETIDDDGWLHTGDLGYYDEDHQFFIVDRLKELIKYKGFQVAPAELEGLLLSDTKIKDAGVIGIPDAVAGELPFAFIVKQPDSIITEKEVKDFVAKNASNAKWLRGGVKFVDEIPKNPSGKILRRELRDLYKNMRAKL
jgi:4-coumarate--CoA ligase